MRTAAAVTACCMRTRSRTCRVLIAQSNYLLVNHLVAEAYALELDERGRINSPGTVMLGTMATCAQAVLDGRVKVYVTDTPILQWLAFTYLSAPDLYVSQAIRKNPLSWAFPQGSLVRPKLDAAIMTMLVNATWLAQYNAIIDQWLPTSSGTAEPDPVKDLIVGPFVAAMVLTATWLLGLAGEESWRAYKAHGEARRAPAGKQAAGDDADEAGGAGADVASAEQLAHEAAVAAQAAAERAAELVMALAAARAAAAKAG